MAKSCVLDTSAILSYTQGEDGSDVVGDILTAAKRHKQKVYVSFISFMESYYVMWQEKGEQAAKELVFLLGALPIERVESNPRLTLSAGRIKANHKLSVADAFVAATALETQSILVHKDPELQALSSYLETVSLPYK